jgi:hypothetical protein
LDILAWVAIYGITGWLRSDDFYSAPFQLFLVELLQVAVIVQALFIIGGYDRQTEELYQRILEKVASGPEGSTLRSR